MKTTEGTNAKTSMLRGERKKEVKLIACSGGFKNLISGTISDTHLSYVAWRRCRSFSFFPYFLMGAFGALYSG